MNFTTGQLELLYAMLTKSECVPAIELANEIRKALDQKKIGIGKLTEIRHCNHQWEPLSEKAVKMCGSPAQWGLSDLPEEEIHELYMQQTSKCRICGLPYRFRSVDLKAVETAYDNEFSVNITAAPSVHYYDALKAGYDKDQERLDEQITAMKKKISRLQEELEKKKSGI